MHTPCDGICCNQGRTVTTCHHGRACDWHAEQTARANRESKEASARIKEDAPWR